MKTTDKTTHTSNSQGSQISGVPFFQMKEEGTSFLQARENQDSLFGASADPPPFFSSVGIQAKLTLGQPGDKYEQEADAMADQVVQTLSQSSGIQRKCAACEQEEQGIAPKIQQKSIFESNEDTGEGQVQRKCATCEAQQISPVRLQAKSSSIPNLQASSDLESRLSSTKGGGNALPEATRGSMESAFGADFSGVRVHTDNSSVQMNQQLGAQAFTHGSDVYFNSGKYDTQSSGGQHLLAHELTHTIQQGKSKSISKKKGNVSAQGIRGLKEDEFNPNQSFIPAQQTMLQRVANWNAGPVHETINLAQMMLGQGGTPVTWPTLNGTQFWSGPEASAAIKPPTISTKQTSNNAGTGAIIGGALGGVAGAIGGGLIGSQIGTYKTKVTSVDTNTGSFDETILTKGPWSTVASKATVNGSYPMAACIGAGNTTFQAKGDPNDNYVYTANRRHEDHHANDHNIAFDNTIKKWDTKLTKAMNSGTEYSGSSAADAEANLWAAMGGTSTEIATAFYDECQAAVNSYHGSAKGGPFGNSGNGSDKTCVNSWVNVTNPS